MALPDKFNEWSHLKSTLIKTQNKIVKHEFRDIGDESWSPDITLPRGSLRVACTLKANDTANMTIIRIFLFYVIIRKLKDIFPVIYSIPSDTFHDIVRFKPQVTLLFEEDTEDAHSKERIPITSQISYRLTGETTASMTSAKVNSLATRIKTKLATGTPFKFKKGEKIAFYADQENGYNFQIYVDSKEIAKDVIQEILGIESKVPDWDFLKINSAEQDYSLITGTQTILGEKFRKRRYRPTGWVHFVKAELHLHGRTMSVALVSRSDKVRSMPIEWF